MKRFLVIFMVLGAILLPLSVQAAERKFSIFGFDDIRILGGVDVVITTGKGPSASAQAASRRMLDRVSLRKSGNQLVVTVREQSVDRSNYGSDEPVTVYLSTYAVDAITHLGSGRVTLDKLAGRSSRARLGGFGSMSIGDVDSDALTVTMNGGGQLSLAGKADAARIELLGASIFDGAGLKVEKLKLVQRGPASSQLTVAREADISNHGTGKIHIAGRPNCKVHSTNSADIICNPKR